MQKLIEFIVAGFFIASSTCAQNLAIIENDLVSSFKKIEDANDTHNGDAINKANDLFVSKLKIAATKYPSTLIYPFNSLTSAHVNVVSSSDGKFRVYSWDTWKGGTMHVFQNLFQFKPTGKRVSIFEKPNIDNDVSYEKIYTFQNKGLTYYLVSFLFIESTRYSGAGIEVFAIDNGRLNAKMNLIKTSSGLTNTLFYEYQFSPKKRNLVDPIFNSDTKTIKISLIDDKLNPTGKYIYYKFNGQYFVKVK